MGRFSTGDDDWGGGEWLEMTVGGGERLEMTVGDDGGGGGRLEVDGGGGDRLEKRVEVCVCVCFALNFLGKE